MAKLIADNGPLVGEKTLVSTHIDSWEVGSQNWTPPLPRGVPPRRGYDPLPLLPVMTGRVVDSLEVSERFLWDLRQTVSRTVGGELRRPASASWPSGTACGCRSRPTATPCDDMAYGGRADEPMGEFWSWAKYGAANSCTEMASAAHVYGRRILGAEAFTATDNEKWLGHPATSRPWATGPFAKGINRFVFHRYAMQPWLDSRPGMTMGPWGLHYERTQTWWEQSRAWHEYLARCQYLLAAGAVRGRHLLSRSPKARRGGSAPPAARRYRRQRPGYNFDGCPPEVVLTRMSVHDGRLVLPDGMSYRMLVLPRRGDDDAAAACARSANWSRPGRRSSAAAPLKSPSLAGYPACDAEVRDSPTCGATAR